MYMKNIFLLLSWLILLPSGILANPIKGMLERIDKGASNKFVVELHKSPNDFFELDRKGDKVVIRGNTYINIATGINWYLKYHAGIHLSWNGMHASLPDVLPPVLRKERHETNLALRYDFNYCTYSYSMAFWDWKRWEKELDWMALHGINLPLAAVGHECVWRNLLLRLGFSKQQINNFIAGPAFLAWWEMNNLEGWGGPNPDSWYEQQEALQKKILQRMKEWGMHPVLPGYSGMIPSKLDLGKRIDSGKEEKTAGDTSSESAQSTLNKWNGFDRPGILLPDDPKFTRIANLFYEETEKLYGTSDYYSIDPFHEAKNLPAELDFGKAGRAIMDAMKKANPKAVWVVQGWTENPRPVWSPTFVLVTCGAASMSLATLMYYIDIRNKQKWCRFFIIFGVNPLFLYVLSEVLAIMMGSTGWKAAAYAAIHSGITDAYLASAVYALVFTLFLGCIGYPLYLKKIYIKL